MKKLKALFWKLLRQNKVLEANRVRKEIERAEIDQEINKPKKYENNITSKIK